MYPSLLKFTPYTVIAASSGNTGAAVATIGVQMGYDVTIITNKKCSEEKCNYITEAGAKLWLAEDLPDQFPDILTDVNCYMEQERVIAENYPEEYFSVNQYNNLDNMMAHYETTAQEIWDQSKKSVTHFVMAASTGGTIMGVGRFLKEKNQDVNVVLSDPHKSTLAGILTKARGQIEEGDAMLKYVNDLIESEGSGIQIEGAGKEDLTEIMTVDGQVLKYVDEAISIHDFDAFDACREFELANNGVRIGGSAGLNICASRQIAEKLVKEGTGEEGATLVTILCDDGNKYASKIFNDEWMEANDTRGPKVKGEKAKDEVTPSEEDTSMGYRLDPTDWDAYRAEMHQLLDSCVDRMESYREKSWIPPTLELAEKVKLKAPEGVDGSGQPLSEVMDSLVDDVMPYATGNTNPRFFGWVRKSISHLISCATCLYIELFKAHTFLHPFARLPTYTDGAGIPSSIAADLVAATMNSNCGGRNQGAADVEVSCINFLTQAAGFPAAVGDETEAFGVLTGGTSQATIYALMAARTKKFGLSVRKMGILELGPVAVYISQDAHSCINRAMECVGHGSDSVVRIPQNKDGTMNIESLRKRLQEDKDAGITPLAIVGE